MHMMDATRVIPKGWHFMYLTPLFSHAGLRNCIRNRAIPCSLWRILSLIWTFNALSGRCLAGRGLHGREIGSRKTVPELLDAVPHNPFKVDTYQL
ncbi:hypothetical protein B0H13DRAFT_2149424, partial [Mycena leptocephala]